MSKHSPRVMVGMAALGRAGLLRTTALQAAAVLVLASPALPQPAPGARPAGGVVVGGSASIGQTAAQTTVTQGSQRAAIDWRSFDVGRDHAVQFQQPNSQAVVLNRVTGPDPSQIAGRISANGQVVITNQSGVVFHQGSQVDAAGLVVSAAGITVPNFMAGRMVFDQAPKPDAAVTNAGTITVKEAGLAALVAPRVANSGVISARMGRAVLAGAETHTVDLYGDGLLSIDVTGQVRTAPKGADGKPVAALVTNTGTIIADGGSVVLTAAAADGIVQNLVQAGGRIQANAADGRAGTVVVAGVGGSVRIEGQVSADGAQAGTVIARASGAVVVAAGANVSASGPGGGGAVTIGHRTNTASATVEAGATIAVDGTGAAKGGKVAVLARGLTTFDGKVFARGGREAGDGGTVEVSGGTVAMTGTVDTGAPKGRVGDLLIDPTDVTVSDHGGDGTVITPASIQSSSGNVTIQADNSIVVSSSVNLSNDSTQTLTFDAGNFTRIDAGVSVAASGGVGFNTSPGGVSLLGNVNSRLLLNMTGALTQGPGSVVTASSITGTAGSIALTSTANQITSIGGNGGFSPATLRTTAGDMAITSAANPLTVQGGYFAAGLVVPNGRTITLTADTMTFLPNGGAVASAPNGTIALQPLTAGRPVEVKTGAPTAGRLSIDAAAVPNLQSSVLSLGTATSGTLDLNANAAATTINYGATRTLAVASGTSVVQTGAIQAGAIGANVPSVTLANGSNTIPVITGANAPNGFALHTGGTLTVNGAIVSNGTVNLSSGSTMTLAANVSGATVRLDSFNGDTLSSSGDIVQTAGIVTAASLEGQGRSLALNQPGNQVSATGDFHTATGFSLRSTTGLNVGGPLLNDAGAVTLNLGGVLTQPSAVLNAGITTPTLTGTASAVNLNTNANLVGTLGAFTTTTGSFGLVTRLGLTAGPPPFVIQGPVSVPNGQNVAITADAVAFGTGATISAPNGAVAFSPLTAGRPIELTSGAATLGTLSISQAGINGITTGALQLGNSVTGPVTLGLAGQAIDLTGHASGLGVVSAGAVTQGAGARITTGGLSVTAASLNLPGQNVIGRFNGSTLAGAATLNSTSDLIVQGISAGGAANIASGGLMTILGDIAAPSIALTSGLGGFTQVLGNVATPGTLTLTSTGSFAQQGGTLAAGTLAATVQGFDASVGNNQIVNLGNFTAQNFFALRNGRSLNVSGTATLPDSAFTIARDLTVNGALSANTLTLNVTGNVTDTPPGSVTANFLQGSAASLRLDGSIGTINAFNSTNGFTLISDRPLTVVGPLVDGTSVSLTGKGNYISPSIPALTVAGNISAPTVTLAGTRDVVSTSGGAGSGGIAQTAGQVRATTLTMTAEDGIAQTGGSIIASTVNVAGQAFTVLLDSTTNQIGTLGSASAVGGLRVRNSQSLAVAGPVTDTASVAFDVTGGLSLSGTVNAPAVDLRATGAITQPGGAITTANLTGAAGSAALNQGANAITTLGALTSAGNFSLVDGANLTVAGSVTAGGPTPTLSLASDRITLRPGGSLTAVGGTVALAPATPGAPFPLSSLIASGITSAITANTLQVGSATTGAITIDGAFNLSGTNTVRFVSGSTITETANGSITGNTLSASGTTITLGGANRFTTLGDVTATGSFTLTNAQALNLVGTIAAGTTVQLDVTGALTQTAGSITANLLTGSAGSVSLTSTANRIANLGPFVTIGDFALTDGRSLTVVAPVDPGDVTITVNGDLVLNSSVTANTLTFLVTGAITEGAQGSVIATTLRGSAASARLDQGNSVGTLADFATTGAFTLRDSTALAVTGPVTGSSVSLTSIGNTTIAGSVTAGDVALTTLRGNILQTAGAVTATNQLTLTSSGLVSQTGGAIAAGSLTGSSAGTTSLASSGNRIGTLNTYSSVGGFALRDGQSLTQAGTLTDTVRVGLTVAGNLTVGGTITAPLVDLGATGAITQPSGAIIASTLQGSSGSTALNQAGNAIGTLGAFANQGTFSLVDGTALNVGGPVSAVGTLSLASDAITLQPGGSLSAPGGTVALATRTPGAPLSLTSFVPPSTTSAVTADTLQVGNATTGPITIAGSFALPNVNTLALVSGGSITETAGGAITVGRLTASGTTVRLDGANAVGTLGTSSSTGDFVLVNGGVTPLGVAGVVTAGGAMTLQAGGALSLGGTINANTLTLAAPQVGLTGVVTAGSTLLNVGSFVQTGGAFNTGQLSGTSTGAVILGSAGGVAAVSALSDFSAPSLTLSDSAPLTVSGTLRTPTLTLSTLRQLTLQGGTILSDNVNIVVGSFGGVLTQAGTTSFAPSGSGRATVRLSVNTGTITLNDLSAPGANLVLAMNGGRAVGTLAVADLFVQDTRGSATLLGSVAGRTGFDAAIASRITAFDVNYTLNGCAIASVTCGAVLIPVAPLVVFPSTIRPDLVIAQDVVRVDRFNADLVTLDIVRQPSDSDFALPNISDRDY